MWILLLKCDYEENKKPLRKKHTFTSEPLQTERCCNHS